MSFLYNVSVLMFPPNFELVISTEGPDTYGPLCSSSLQPAVASLSDTTCKKVRDRWFAAEAEAQGFAAGLTALLSILVMAIHCTTT
jgi:hypothetical protein